MKQPEQFFIAASVASTNSKQSRAIRQRLVPLLFLLLILLLRLLLLCSAHEPRLRAARSLPLFSFFSWSAILTLESCTAPRARLILNVFYAFVQFRFTYFREGFSDDGVTYVMASLIYSLIDTFTRSHTHTLHTHSNQTNHQPNSPVYPFIHSSKCACGNSPPTHHLQVVQAQTRESAISFSSQLNSWHLCDYFSLQFRCE